MNTPLPVDPPIAGVLWTWILPVLLFATASVATWLLYRHFSDRGEGS